MEKFWWYWMCFNACRRGKALAPSKHGSTSIFEIQRAFVRICRVRGVTLIQKLEVRDFLDLLAGILRMKSPDLPDHRYICLWSNENIDFIIFWPFIGKSIRPIRSHCAFWYVKRRTLSQERRCCVSPIRISVCYVLWWI